MLGRAYRLPAHFGRRLTNRTLPADLSGKDGWPTALQGMSSTGAALWLAARVIGYELVTPLAEELAFRGYVTRRLIATDINRVPMGTFRWLVSGVIAALRRLPRAALAPRERSRGWYSRARSTGVGQLRMRYWPMPRTMGPSRATCSSRGTGRCGRDFGGECAERIVWGRIPGDRGVARGQ